MRKCAGVLHLVILKLRSSLLSRFSYATYTHIYLCIHVLNILYVVRVLFGLGGGFHSSLFFWCWVGGGLHSPTHITTHICTLCCWSFLRGWVRVHSFLCVRVCVGEGFSLFGMNSQRLDPRTSLVVWRL